ncbi:hypothetical protein NE865_07243 [Phthorimaea operculella]|nr:hypothetical protein NE865_07243 [Phthorimaea operculella]
MWPDEDPYEGAHGRGSSGSEVVITGRQEPACAPADALPRPDRPYFINSMNISTSPGARIGDNYVTVTNVHHNDEVVKAGFLGLELVSPAHARRLRCGVAVFVCWALVLASGLAIFFFQFALSTKYRIDIGLNETWYLRRREWQAQPPSSSYQMSFLKLPVKIAMIGHSAESNCSNKYDCIKLMRATQIYHLERMGDIGPNFLVGGDEGWVFEGAGGNVVGMATAGQNSKQISIMFLGDYTKDFPNQHQLDHVAVLLEVLVRDGILDENYTLLGYCQILPYTIPPGPHIMKRLPEFPHWIEENATKCVDNPKDGPNAKIGKRHRTEIRVT